ncbi:OprO/OprP family phosphate-selective porin [Microbulbifer thermotolerans]|uniref:OprO/OprP family phosphate-selective porin n=2 Tax=Microbulbifer thermotolerans TaxID=252514 RepID=UPI00224B1473|nr:porin [Microbulbifer thermotolerans]
MYCRGFIFSFMGAALFHPAVADQPETKSWLKISANEGNFSAELGGRIHFDTYLFDSDIEDPISTTEFRRVRLAVTGHLWKWKYKLERDFSSSGTGGLRDVYIATEVLGGKLTIGNFKPYRSMEELTSSNEITMMERSFTSASGIYFGRSRQQGIGWHTHWGCYTFGAAGFNLRNPGAPRNEGLGAAGRITWAPINDQISTVHLGISASHENANRNSNPIEADVAYAGRRGPTQLTALTPGGRDFFFDIVNDNGDQLFFFGNQGGKADIAGLEFAATYGPVYLQSEYAYGKFDGDYYLSEVVFEDFYGIPPTFACDPDNGCFIGDQDVKTWYIMGSWMITGEHKPYDSAKGVFRSAKPHSDWGAWELTARYETIENKDIPDLEADSFRLGVNVYLNPRVRFMLNIILGDDEFTGDKTRQLAFRAQASW